MLFRSQRNSLLHVDALDLLAARSRWREAGQPTSNRFQIFAEGRRPDLRLFNQPVVIDGTTYFAELALAKSKSGFAGTLIITSNNIFLWQHSSGSIRRHYVPIEGEDKKGGWWWQLSKP